MSKSIKNRHEGRMVALGHQLVKVAHAHQQRKISFLPSKRRYLIIPMAFLLIALCVILSPALYTLHSHPINTFVTTVNSTHHGGLQSQCRPFYIAGFNIDTIALAVTARSGRRLSPGEPSGRKKVAAVLHHAAKSGLNVVRTWAHTADSSGEFSLQLSPGGIYDESVFRGLDYVIATASKLGIRVILSLADNWHYYGGIDQYVDWSVTTPPREARFPRITSYGDVNLDDFSPEYRQYEAQRHALFFTDSHAKQLYKSHMEQIMRRKNVYSGRIYSEDPTLLGIDLINEVRCEAELVPECLKIVTDWFKEMAQHAADLAPNQLITTGSDGFFGGDKETSSNIHRAAHDNYRRKSANPGKWASLTGQDFELQHSLPGINLATIHLWSDTWNVPTQEAHNFTAQWLKTHLISAKRLKKPLLLEEFNRPLLFTRSPDNVPQHLISSIRDPLFKQVYKFIEAAVDRGEPVAGSLFWRWDFSVYPGPQRFNDPHSISPDSSTFDLITRHAQFLQDKMARSIPDRECLMAAHETAGLEEGTVGCWVPETRFYGYWKTCISRPEVCEVAMDSEKQEYDLAVYLSKSDCCRVGGGAFKNGCTSMFSLF